MATRVLVHVGAPKTGTSFVQDVLFLRRADLAARGVLYPADRHDAHFLAALDLMQLPWGGLEAQATGAWDGLAQQVRDWPGTAIVSHEILGTASRAQVARALESLGAGSGAEVHVVLSARDLARQVPAEWQENLKHRRTTTYRDFLANVVDETRSSEVGRWFWGVQEVPDILDRWGSTLPRERVHLVTVPPPGAPRDLLWQRFAGVLGLDPEEFAPETNRTNSSLGVPEAVLVRRLNERVREVLPNERYRELVRERLVHANLAARTDTPRLALPPATWRWASDLSRRWVSELALRGYDVVGSLDELLPTDPPIPFTDPEHPDEAQVADAAVAALAVMTLETARLREVEEARDAEVADLRGQLDRLYGTRSYRLKQQVVASSRTNPLSRLLLAGYRRLRGSSSRST